MEEFGATALELLQDIGAEALYILPYLAVGVLLEAIIRTFKWHVKIRHALTRFGSFSIVVATLLGVASPLCACATLPLVISLLLAGLPLAPAMALLITSPLMSPAGYSMLSGMLGVQWATLVAVCAVALGLFGGGITMVLRRYGFDEANIFRKNRWYRLNDNLRKGSMRGPETSKYSLALKLFLASGIISPQ